MHINKDHAFMARNMKLYQIVFHLDEWFYKYGLLCLNKELIWFRLLNILQIVFLPMKLNRRHCLCVNFILLKVNDCRICGDPHSVLRFAFVEFANERK